LETRRRLGNVGGGRGGRRVRGRRAFRAICYFDFRAQNAANFANLADNLSGEVLGFTMEEERDVLAIMVPDTIRDTLMENVNKEFGMRTNAQAVLCSVGVDKAMRI